MTHTYEEVSMVFQGSRLIQFQHEVTLAFSVENREVKQPRRHRQRQRQKEIGFKTKTATLHVHHAF